MGRSGFEEITPLAGAREVLAKLCAFHGRTETIPVESGAGRVLGESLSAPRAVPHYDRAAMDGFAVRAEDTFGATERSPERLAETADVVEPGTAVPVHTGSAIPDGADAVVMVEYTERRESGLDVFDAVSVGENIAPAGEDVDEGQELFDAGGKLAPADLGICRATGIDELTVRERPTVSVIPTGEELVESDPADGQIVETNGLTVSSLVDQWGGQATYRDIVTDDKEKLRSAIESDLDHDIVVTTGGSSVGERDLVPDVVESLGEVHVHGVAIKPGYPVALGSAKETPILMLPGYPVSCLLNAVLFARPAVAARGGWTPRSPPTIDAVLTEKIPSDVGSRTFARVQVEISQPKSALESESEGESDSEIAENTARATPLRASGAGALSSVAMADGWVVVPESREGIPAGETVPVQQWDWEWRP